MFKKLKRISHYFYYLFQLYEIFFANLPEQTKDSIIEICEPFTKNDSNSLSLDLGCGNNPKNPFNAKKVYGLDLFDNKDLNIQFCKLGFVKLPFDDNHFDYITAFDLIEHIPRYYENCPEGNTPFIFLMNEIWRVLKNEGIFLSHTPIYPFPEVFQDPTHNNFLTSDTFKIYFSDQKNLLATSYGIKSNFKILKDKMRYRHQVILMQKTSTNT
ncbi:class I SAM-dependent methyltransferase [Gammaproteobacteria bacterium]|nr:class I SAM-dependent methyltransferase [Gammaproteobacteria bacterium]